VVSKTTGEELTYKLMEIHRINCSVPEYHPGSTVAYRFYDLRQQAEKSLLWYWGVIFVNENYLCTRLALLYKHVETVAWPYHWDNQG